jgi:CVNH domain
MKFGRVLLSSLAPAVVVASLAAAPEPASARDSQLPEGSWHQSCRDGYIRDGVLYADCLRTDGRYNSASAQIASCQVFGNRDGQLFCESRGDRNDGDRNQWYGSFQDACRDISVSQYGKLSAKCRTDSGNYKRSKLSPEKCPGYRAGIHNGTLICEPRDEYSGADRNQWRGSFRETCRDISIESDGDLMATCQSANGGWRQARPSSRNCDTGRAGNHDGNLVCESRDERGANNRSQWNGSFRESCRDISIESDGDLMATCQSANGGWRQARLSPRNCDSQRAGNRDGELLCER